MKSKHTSHISRILAKLPEITTVSLFAEIMNLRFALDVLAKTDLLKQGARGLNSLLQAASLAAIDEIRAMHKAGTLSSASLPVDLPKRGFRDLGALARFLYRHREEMFMTAEDLVLLRKHLARKAAENLPSGVSAPPPARGVREKLSANERVKAWPLEFSEILVLDRTLELSLDTVMSAISAMDRAIYAMQMKSKAFSKPLRALETVHEGKAVSLDSGDEE